MNRNPQRDVGNVDRGHSRGQPPKSVAHLGTAVCLLFLGILVGIPALAQLVAPAAVPAATKSDASPDSLGRSTPKGTVLGFMVAARKGEDELAAQYLNTRLRGKAAALLAHQLFIVLDRRLPPRLHQLSDKPEGSLSDPLKPNAELVGTIASDYGNVDIFLERVDRGKSGPVWLFSSKTLDSIPDLYEETNLASPDDVLPEFVVSTRIAGIALFQWLAIFVGMPLLYYFTVLLNRFLSPLIGLLRRRLYGKPDLPNPEFLPKPVRLLLLALVIYRINSSINLPLTTRQFWSSTATVITITASVWLLIRLNSWTEQYTGQLLLRRNITGVTSMLRLARRVVDLLVIFAGVLVALHYFGVNTTAALAGLGVGGIAVALAAQKTLENVIGGVSLVFDQAVRVGDSLKVGDIQGTVEDMGLRSTRIRTADRTVVSVPNGQIANMTLENFSLRDKFWLHPILALRYGTTSQQICTVLERIRSLLDESQHIERNSVRVNFLRFAPSSLEVEVFAYVLARDWNEFLEIQERLLLRIMESVESTGVQIALPSQTILVDVSASKDAAERALSKVPAPRTEFSDDVGPAQSAQDKSSSP